MTGDFFLPDELVQHALSEKTARPLADLLVRASARIVRLEFELALAESHRKGDGRAP